MEQAELPHAYEARRRRSVWADSVRLDAEIAALDEVNGEWILCATCAEHFRKTGRGRKPNDPLGFKVKMNGRFQEAAWVMHKNRVVAHRLVNGFPSSLKRRLPSASDDDSIEQNDQSMTSAESEDASDGLQRNALLLEPLRASIPSTLVYRPAANRVTTDLAVAIQIPLSGWKCPGIVPTIFYNTSGDLVDAFAKYYVGSYRVNVVRDLRTDRVLLYSHECENATVQRHQSLACHNCHDVWVNHKSFRRILKKMERYNHVEAILRRAWSLSSDDLAALSRFKHASGANLTTEGRRLKQAAIDALNYYGTTTRGPAMSYDGHLELEFEPSTHEYGTTTDGMLSMIRPSDRSDRVSDFTTIHDPAVNTMGNGPPDTSTTVGL